MIPKNLKRSLAATCTLSVALSVTLAGAACAARADELPLWEAGAGVAAVHFPDYRGSNEDRTYVFPVPDFVYRGDFLKVQDQKVRGLFFHNDFAEVDVSLNGTVPVKSSRDAARSGMPNLDPTLEVGPSLNIFLFHTDDGKFKTELRMPLRAVNAVDSSGVHEEGFFFQPNINVDVKDAFGNNGWKLGLLAGPVFVNRRYAEYIYGVAPQYATPERSAYQAPGGFAGGQFVAAISKHYSKLWVGAFLKLDTLQGASFEDSPLVKSRHTVAGGIALTYVLAHSSEMVEVHP